MDRFTHIACNCGSVELLLSGGHIVSTECCCTSCNAAGAILQKLPSAPELLEENSTTRFVLYRKDRVSCSKGSEQLREYRLTEDSKTRRVVAACCNSAMFLDFTQGHWISLYGRRWPAKDLPGLEQRTMVSDFPNDTKLSDGVSHSQAKFFAKLIAAWVAMGFRTPKIQYVQGKLDVP